MEGILRDLGIFYTDTSPTTPPAKGVVVFIHAFPLNHTMWASQVALLEKNYRIITYDQRGHGKSEISKTPFLFETLVDDLFALLDHLNVTKAILCGLSMGGYVALRAAERSLDRISGLILSDTRSAADSNAAKIKRAGDVRLIQVQGLSVFADKFAKALLSEETTRLKPEVVALVKKMTNANTPRGVQEMLVALASRTDTAEVLPQIKVPTLICVGEHDIVTPPADSRDLHERIKGSRLVVLPQSGHLSNLENTNAFNTAMSEFMTTLPA